jgi:hypothetical protein
MGGVKTQRTIAQVETSLSGPRIAPDRDLHRGFFLIRDRERHDPRLDERASKLAVWRRPLTNTH